MKLLIIGASRGVGARLLEQSLDRGHQVTALARSPNEIKSESQNLRIIKGDIRDAEAVKAAVKGQDAVCIAIGIGPTRKPVSVFSEGTKNVVEAMTVNSVGRLICVTGIGAGDSRNHGGFLYDCIIYPLLLKSIYEDKDIQESIIKESSLNWLIVRPGFLTDGPVTGKYRAITDLTGIKAGKISRSDVAHFILEQLDSTSLTGKTPLLTY